MSTLRLGNAAPTGLLKRLVIGMFAWLALSLPAHAVLEVDINKGQVDPIPIALPNFSGGDPKSQQFGIDITTIIGNNLERSGLFRPLPQNSYLEQVTDFNAAPQFVNWQTIQARALVTGQAAVLGDGRIRADFRLWDVYGQNQIVGLQFVTSERNWRRIGHLISDAIYKAMTGEEGYFDSRIVYIAESGPRTSARKC
jgi:TolB protein